MSYGSVLILEEDYSTRKLLELVDFEGKFGLETDISASMEGIEDQEYKLVVTDYESTDLQKACELADDLIVYTAISEERIEIPEESIYVRKELGFDSLEEAVEQYGL
jgi:hypothetical protein